MEGLWRVASNSECSTGLNLRLVRILRLVLKFACGWILRLAPRFTSGVGFCPWLQDLRLLLDFASSLEFSRACVHEDGSQLKDKLRS